jgi:hypothetical protein
MIVTMSFDGDGSSSLSLVAGTPTRAQFMKLASRLWRNHVELRNISDVGAPQNYFYLRFDPALSDKKVNVIKALREVAGLGPIEAMDLVDASSQYPQKVTPTGTFGRDDGMKIMREAGAKASLRAKALGRRPRAHPIPEAT